MKPSYCYEADWRSHAFPEDESHLVSETELRERYESAELNSGSSLKTAGIPILSDGKHVVFNGDNEMNLIFGATGSGKSRKIIAPFITMCAKAGQSMVIPDIKGEFSHGVLSPYIMGILKAEGYNCRVINFRDLDGDGFNILQEPYRLYREGHRDEAMSEVNKIVHSLASIYHGTVADPFWEKTANQFLMGVIVMVYELCDDKDKINMLSLATYTNEASCEYMKEVVERIHYDNNIMAMLRSVVSEPERTRMSTLATVNSFFNDFIINEKLLRMLSTSTFELEEIYREKTALFLIIPDETDTFGRITGLLLSQISSFLVREAYRFGGELPRRVNFICDEFAQYYVPNMAKNISAHRSRNIRWTIVCQSRKQLEMAYHQEAGTILANCTNIFFLSSPEQELLEELSLRAGYTNVSSDGQPRRLISVAALRGMKKGREYTDVYFAAGDMVCVNRLLDISLYECVKGYTEPGHLPRYTYPELQAYTAKQMLVDVHRCREAYDQAESGRKRLNQSERMWAERYRNLFKDKK